MDDTKTPPDSARRNPTKTFLTQRTRAEGGRGVGRTLFTAISRRARRRSSKILIDVALLGAFVVVFLTREASFDPDYLLHSWVGLGLVPVLCLHLTGNSGWISRVAHNRRRDREARLGALNVVLASTTVVCILSGVPLWLGWSDAAVVSAAHFVTGVGSILVVVAHLAMNRRRILSLARAR